MEAFSNWWKVDMIIRKENVIAVDVQGKLYCTDCVSDAGMDDPEAGDFILENSDDGNVIFSSGCNKLIT